MYVQKVDLKTKNKEKEAELQRAFKEKLAKLQKAQRDMCGQTPAPRRAYDNMNNTNTVRHGGIVRPFKAPAQTGPSGVECVDRDGDNFTTLKEMQAALMKKKKMLGKRKKKAT